MANRDFGKKPYMGTEKDDFRDTMKYSPLSQNQDPRFKKHSEFLKPYSANEYPEMENYSPIETKYPYMSPTVDLDIPTNPCEEAKKIEPKLLINEIDSDWVSLRCGGNATLYLTGAVEPVSYKMVGYYRWGSLAGNMYTAPTCQDCCENKDGLADTLSFERYVFILAIDSCGRQDQRIIYLVCPEDWFDGAIIQGPDAPVDGDQYTIDGFSGNVVWSISKGKIDSNGVVYDLAGECGTATITAYWSCVDVDLYSFQILEQITKTVSMPLGVWECISIIYTCPAGLTCSEPTLIYGSGIWVCGFKDGLGQCTSCDGIDSNGYQIMHRNNCVSNTDPCNTGISTCTPIVGCGGGQSVIETSTVQWRKIC